MGEVHRLGVEDGLCHVEAGVEGVEVLVQVVGVFRAIGLEEPHFVSEFRGELGEDFTDAGFEEAVVVELV